MTMMASLGVADFVGSESSSMLFKACQAVPLVDRNGEAVGLPDSVLSLDGFTEFLPRLALLATITPDNKLEVNGADALEDFADFTQAMVVQRVQWLFKHVHLPGKIGDVKDGQGGGNDDAG